jgi:hypothetical protein
MAVETIRNSASGVAMPGSRGEVLFHEDWTSAMELHIKTGQYLLTGSHLVPWITPKTSKYSL